MDDQTLLQKIKKHIRRSHDQLDDDLADTIAICLADLRACGIHEPTGTDPQGVDPLILSAVRLYCKEADSDDPVKAARFREGYDSLKSFMMMASEYSGEATSDE